MYASVEEFIHFIGFSYGSFLGAVYANAFPDRVDQFMVDSILDLSDYSGEIFKVISSSLTHTEDAMNAIGSACDAAGPETCVLAGMPINGSSDDSTENQSITSIVDAFMPREKFQCPLIETYLVNDTPMVSGWPA